MVGLDRAAVWAELEVEADLVTLGIRKKFPSINPKKLSGNTQTYLINQSNINEIRIKEKPNKTFVKVDFSYSRYGKNNNIEPLSDEITKVLVEESIIKIIEEITLQTVTRKDLYYEYFEFCVQETVKSFYAFHNIFTTFYRALSRNFESKERAQFNNFDTKLDIFYSTGFSFQVDKGWKLRLYSKTHENNKKNLEKITKPTIRLEHRLNQTMIKRLCFGNKVENLTIDYITASVSEKLGIKLYQVLCEEINRDIDILEKKFENYTSRTLKILVRDYQENILDEKTINYVVTQLTNKSDRQKKRYRQQVKISLEEFQARGSPARNNFGNIERLELFINKILKIKCEVKCGYNERLTFHAT